MKKLIAEFIGTFFLVLTIGLAVIPGSLGLFAPFAIVAALMGMIFACGHISAAHFNPAVTVAFFIRGKCPARDVVPYVIAQLIAAAAGAFVVEYLVGKAASPLVIADVPKAFVAEFLFTFAMVFVILNVATAKAAANNSFYGLAIGMSVLGGIFAVGSISGAAFNPAVAIALGLMNIVNISQIWIHFGAEFAGGILAAFAFKLVNPSER